MTQATPGQRGRAGSGGLQGRRFDGNGASVDRVDTLFRRRGRSIIGDMPSDATTANEGATHRVIRRFATWEEFKAFVGEPAPTRADDTPVLLGADGRRATADELRAFIDEHERRQRGDG